MSFPNEIYSTGLGAPYTVVGTTKLYPIGTRLVLEDGRVFRYAKSSGACYAGQGCDFVADEAVGYTTIKTTAAIGVEEVEITAATHDAIAADELVGGYTIIYGATNADVQFRGIVGNDASIADAALTVRLDAPLVKAVTGASTGCEVFYNPYNSLALSAGANFSKAGIPAAEVSASGKYFWVQTWGPCWCAPRNVSFADANDRAAYWRENGSIEGEIASASKDTAVNSTQYAGFLITEGFTAGPLLMLQVSP